MTGSGIAVLFALTRELKRASADHREAMVMGEAA